MTDSKDPKKAAPWVLPLRVEDVSESGRHVELRADAQMLAQLAAYTGVRAMERADASFDVTRHGRDGLHVVGEVRAKVGQTCVVTLEPMESEIAEPVDVLFKPAAKAPRKAGGELEVDAAASDPPEPLIDGTVDLGAVATEFLILGIDPYPRKPDATFDTPEADTPEEGPFAALAKLKSGGGADK